MPNHHKSYLTFEEVLPLLTKTGTFITKREGQPADLTSLKKSGALHGNTLKKLLKQGLLTRSADLAGAVQYVPVPQLPFEEAA